MSVVLQSCRGPHRRGAHHHEPVWLEGHRLGLRQSAGASHYQGAICTAVQEGLPGDNIKYYLEFGKVQSDGVEYV